MLHCEHGAYFTHRILLRRVAEAFLLTASVTVRFIGWGVAHYCGGCQRRKVHRSDSVWRHRLRELSQTLRRPGSGSGGVWLVKLGV